MSNYLHARPLPRREVLAYLRTTPLVAEPVRQMALSLAEQLPAEPKPTPREEVWRQYHAAAWPVIRSLHSNRFQLEFALMQARQMLIHYPLDLGRDYRPLGMAHYRLGRFDKSHYEQARQTLEMAEVDNPVTQAFLAMTHHQLGRGEDAKRCLAEARKLAGQPSFAKVPEAQEALKEAEGAVK